jgi:hypothetical protein
MNSYTWHFRPRSPGEAIKGGVDNFAFQMSVDTLVRETIQNSNDQRLHNKIRVEFVVEEHIGSSADKLLTLLGWHSGLRDHLQAIAEGDSHLRARAQMAISAANIKKIQTLTIRDLEARGLEGEEDGQSGNFAMLCRHVLVTDAEKKKLRGGAFGIGKSVLWAFSDASTVLFSSLPKERGSNGKTEKVGEPRFFGRAYLVSHEIGSPKKWHNGDGHFGENVITNSHDWVKSLRGDATKILVQNTGLDRDWKSPGTSILIPFFSNPRVDDVPTQDELIKQIREATQMWFWPSLQSGILEVSVGYREKGLESLENVSMPEWAKLHARALIDGISSEKIDTEGGSARIQLGMKIPKRTSSPIRPAQDSGVVDIHVTRLTEDESNHVPEKVLGSIAMVRGAQMVVEYFKGSIPTLLPMFVGVAKAGEYRGATEEDKDVEMFLRDAEPPAHDRWDKSSEKIGVNYARGGHTQISQFLQEIGKSVRSVLGTSTVSSGRTPRHLAELLKGARGSDKKPRLERFKLEQSNLIRNNDGTVHAAFNAKRNLGKGAWVIKVAVVFVDEQETGFAMPHQPINMSKISPQNVEVNPEVDENGLIRGFQLIVPSDVNEVAGEIVGESGTTFVSMRSAVDLSIRYSSLTGVAV